MNVKFLALLLALAIIVSAVNAQTTTTTTTAAASTTTTTGSGGSTTTTFAGPTTTTTAATTTAATTTTTAAPTTTTTAVPPPPPPPPAAAQKVQSLWTEDKETFSSTLAMSVAAGMVSALSGNPVSVMFVLRTNMVLSLCFPPTSERVSVLQLPFLQKFGPDDQLAYYAGAATFNAAAFVLIFLGFVLGGMVMKSSKGYGLDRAFHNLRFPGVLFSVLILLGCPSTFCAAVTLTSSPYATNIVMSIVVLIFWAVVVLLLPVTIGKVFDAEYVLTQSVQSDEQEKMLKLVGKTSEASGSDRSSSNLDSDEDADRVERKEAGEGQFGGFFDKLREGLEGIRDRTAAGVEKEKENMAIAAKANEDARGGSSLAYDDAEFDEAQQAEQDMRQLAASTVDVLRDMFHHITRTGGDEEKLLAAVHGSGEWRDKKNEEDFLNEEDEEEDPVSFMRRYGTFFEQYNKRNRFHGFIEVFATFGVCACAGFFFFSTQDANCTFQSFTYLGVAVVMVFLLYRRRPFIAKMNHGYSMALMTLHVLSAICIALGALFDARPAILSGYIIGICAVYLNAFRALLDLYLVIVMRVSGKRENWPAIQELTDLFLAAKDRRDRGQMMTGPEMTSDRASARSGKSARSAASKRQARFSQQYGKTGIQLFFKLATESDRYCASRAIPEEFHPFIMRPLPEPIVLVTEERRAAIREKMEKAAAKAKWEAALNQMTQETEAPIVTAADAFAADDFDDEEAEDRERKRAEEERRKAAAEDTSVPKLVRDLFSMGLKTKFDEADRVDLEATKIDDLLFPVEQARAKKLQELQASAGKARQLRADKLEAGGGDGDDAAGAGKDGKDGANGGKKKDVDESFASWIRPNTAEAAENAAAAEREEANPAAYRRARSGTMRQSMIRQARERRKQEEGGGGGGGGGDKKDDDNNNFSDIPMEKSEVFPGKNGDDDDDDLL